MPLNFECHKLRGEPLSWRNGIVELPSILTGGREGRRRWRSERNNLLIKRRLSPGGCVPFTNKLICQDWLVLLIVGQIQGESKSHVNVTRWGAKNRREWQLLVAKTERDAEECDASKADSRQSDAMWSTETGCGCWGVCGRVNATLVNTDNANLFFCQNKSCS